MKNDPFLQGILDTGLIPPGSTVTCAVSGGADSMALLWALCCLREPLNLKLYCAHFNHGLRENAAQDAAFVRDFCQSHNIPFICEAKNVAEEALPGESLELAARRLRYAFLDKTEGLLATAHTADDNLETLLLRLTRGTSLRGMGGIPEKHGRLIRPILFATRTQILEFLSREKISHREDESNQTDFCPRNRMRHHVVPLLRSENPQVSTQALQLAKTLREEDAFLSAQAAEQLAAAKIPGGYSCKKLTMLPPVLYRRALFAILQNVGIEVPEQCHFLLLSGLVQSKNPSAKASFPGNVILERRYDLLCISAASVPIPPTPIQVPGRTHIPGSKSYILCTFEKKSENVQKNASTFLLSCDMIDIGSFVVRSRQEGDRLHLPSGSRSLKRLFIDKKIPASLRDRVPVLADKNGVVAVGGLGADVQRYSADDNACLYIQIEKEDDFHDE